MNRQSSTEVDNLSGVGPDTKATLSKVGITSVENLLMIDPERVAERTSLSVNKVESLREKAEEYSDDNLPSLEVFADSDDPVVGTFQALSRISTHSEKNQGAVLSPAQFVDAYAIECVGEEVSDWARGRGVGPEAVRKNIREAKEALAEEGRDIEDLRRVTA